MVEIGKPEVDFSLYMSCFKRYLFDFDSELCKCCKVRKLCRDRTLEKMAEY